MAYGKFSVAKDCFEAAGAFVYLRKTRLAHEAEPDDWYLLAYVK
jgi:hypothetical protein